MIHPVRLQNISTCQNSGSETPVCDESPSQSVASLAEKLRLILQTTREAAQALRCLLAPKREEGEALAPNPYRKILQANPYRTPPENSDRLDPNPYR